MAEFLSHPVPAAVMLLGLLILVHELGHFLVGKWSGIAVEIFSIGFGARAIGFRRGDTDYRISWIPLGGYVKFYGSGPGEEVPAHLKGKEWASAPVMRRIAVAVAGPIANFLLAIVAYTWIAQQGITFTTPEIGDVMEGSPAEQAGIDYGDVITSIGNAPVKSWKDLETAIFSNPGRSMMVTLDRHGVPMQLTLQPESIERSDMAGKSIKAGRAGIARGELPAALAVVGINSVAGKAGLKNGMLVTNFKFADKSFPVQSWPNFLKGLADAHTAGAKSFVVTVRMMTPMVDDQVPGGGEIREPSPETALEVNIGDAWSHFSTPVVRARELAESLGLSHAQLVIGGGVATKDGQFQIGDRLISMNGKALKSLYDLREVLSANQVPAAKFVLDRSGVEKNVDLQLDGKEVQGPTGRVTIYQLQLSFFGQPKEPPQAIQRYDSFAAAFGYGLSETGKQTVGLVQTLGRLFTGDVPLKALGGPILIAKVAGDSVKHGLQSFVAVLALISINLGVINLFPIPVLDGGQLVMFGWEAIRKKPLNELAIENFQKAGFVLILALVVVATYNDLSRFWKTMLSSVTGLFQ